MIIKAERRLDRRAGGGAVGGETVSDRLDVSMPATVSSGYSSSVDALAAIRPCRAQHHRALSPARLSRRRARARAPLWRRRARAAGWSRCPSRSSALVSAACRDRTRRPRARSTISTSFRHTASGMSMRVAKVRFIWVAMSPSSTRCSLCGSRMDTVGLCGPTVSDQSLA